MYRGTYMYYYNMHTRTFISLKRYRYVHTQPSISKKDKLRHNWIANNIVLELAGEGGKDMDPGGVAGREGGCAVPGRPARRAARRPPPATGR